MSPDEINSFGKLLRLLGSDQSGERAVAALKATKFLTDRKLDWHDIVTMLERPEPARSAPGPNPYGRPGPNPYASQPPPQPPPNGTSIDHSVAVRQCLSLFNFWTEKETNFLLDMQDVYWPSQKQLKWLKSLYERYLREMAK